MSLRTGLMPEECKSICNDRFAWECGIIIITAGNGYIPVITPIAVDDMVNNLNVNPNIAAGAIAIALHAKKFISITDVEGVRMDPTTEHFDLRVSIFDFERLVQNGIIKSDVIHKVEACVRTVEGVVEKTHIIDGRKPHAILLVLLTDEGIGTMI